ncbi:MAG: S8 family serine peptidase, partial [Streptosporangiales bacterium]|nr:S8 family serine peptidase [Streptosporangiales bacterium]
IATPGDDPSLRGVIEYALQHNVVVVAAAGNDKPAQSGHPAEKGPFYPASYPGVLSVGAVDSTGALAPFSDRHSDAGVTAPGTDVTSTFPGPSGDTYRAEQGTSFAAPFVSGLAALIIARDPGLTAAQVVQRIEDTADGSIGTGSGNGLINPVQALTGQVPADEASPQAAPAGAVKINRAPANLSRKVVALSLAGGAFAIAVIVIAAAVVIPAGRRRGWRPGGSGSDARPAANDAVYRARI